MLSANSLSNRIYSALTAAWGESSTIPQEGSEAGNSSVTPSGNLKTLTDAIALGVVAELLQNAQVQTISGAPDGEHTGVIL